MQAKHLYVLSTLCWRRETGLSPPVKYFTDHSKAVLLSGSFLLLMSCVSHAFAASVHCCLVVTCWERADLLALVGDVFRIFVTFPCGVLGRVVALDCIVS